MSMYLQKEYNRKNYKIENLELHITHRCNLVCESCSHYCNQNLTGELTLSEAESWVEGWSKRIEPNIFSILGGEPTLHPGMMEFLLIARKYWKNTHLRIVTNGFLLGLHPELPEFLAKDNNSCLYISIHHNSSKYNEAFQSVINLVEKWQQNYQFQIHYYESYKYWTRRYIVSDNNIFPFTDNDPQKSWEHCEAKHCIQLSEGCLWKCAPLAYLPLLERTHGISESWNRYLEYTPLDLSCSDEELTKFIEKKSEIYCAMCPAVPEKFHLPLPFQHRT